MDTKTIVLIGLAVYFLFLRPSPARTPAYRPVVRAPQPSTSQQVVGIVNSTLPAVGTFLGNVFRGSSTSFQNDGFTGADYVNQNSSVTTDESSDFDYSS